MVLFLYRISFLLEKIQIRCPFAFVLSEFLRLFIRLKLSGLDYVFTVEDQGICIILFCLVEIPAQIFCIVSKIGLFTRLEMFFFKSLVGRLINLFSLGKTLVYG